MPRRIILLILMLCCIQESKIYSSDKSSLTVSVDWDGGKPQGSIDVKAAELENITIERGIGEIKGNRFNFQADTACRLNITVGKADLNIGPGSSIVTINQQSGGFSFFLRDISSEAPFIIPDYQVTVLPAEDGRSYKDVLAGVQKKALKTNLRKIEDEPEASFENAAKHTRNQPCPTWLGLSRDFRLFEVDVGLGYYNRQFSSIRPKFASKGVVIPEIDDNPLTYHFIIGRGVGTTQNVERRLEEGIFPILHTSIDDEDILYQTRTFVSLEQSLLRQENLKGTHYLVADGYSAGHMFTADQQAAFNRLEKETLQDNEETILYFQARAVNRGSAPKYAFFKSPFPAYRSKYPVIFESASGFSKYQSGRIFCISRINGAPMPFEEISILLKPQEVAVFEFYFPHRPVSEERAGLLARSNFEEKRQICRNFWHDKIETAAKIVLPERRIEEMVKAGLLHLDLITCGREPEGTLAPKIGVYSPIGSESAPIVQFMMSMGWQSTARRAIQYFLDKQHEDGLIQNFGGYMLETGAALWSMGEYYRYTRDGAWVEENLEKILKSCRYLIDWRKRNMREELRGQGYGMIDGKVADPEDPFHSFMLNGYGYLGLKRVAEMLSEIDRNTAIRLEGEAHSWREDIRDSYFNAEMKSPAIPLSDGTWSPTAPPWPEADGPLFLYIKPERQYTHGTFTARDALLGPLYLIFQEVIDPDEAAAKRLLDYHADNFYDRNAAFSQPYYSRHAWVQLQRGLVKPFLKTYYNTFAGLADRETYTFWEHYYHVSPHKTHEEGWFLIQTRWMLWQEEGETLKLLSGIPRAWLADGEQIKLENIATYFGPFTLSVTSHIKNNYIDVELVCPTDRKPQKIMLRIPHPEKSTVKEITTGRWHPETESLFIENFKGNARIRITYR